MSKESAKSELTGSQPTCDIRVWSGSCQQSEAKDESDKYLCATCGKIVNLTHEVHHEHFPHISGDDDNLS